MAHTMCWTLFIISTASSLIKISSALCTNSCEYWKDGTVYECFCSTVYCETSTGACPRTCGNGWFGPACQYVSMTYDAIGGSSGLDWLTDHNPTTCNDGRIHPIIVTLDKPIILTWMRLSFKDSDQEIQVTYNDGDMTLTCRVDQTARVDDTVLDISCQTSAAITELTLFGSGVGGLCSLDISGGHNVALQTTALTQSTTLGESYASEAVDGLLPVFDYPLFPAVDCTHTALSDVQAWWTVTFPRPVNINDIEIYNRPGPNQDRLVGFTLNIYSESSNIFQYTDPSIGTDNSEVVYYISDIGIRNGKIIEVVLPNSENELTLCEVVVHGELICETGKYGLRCENTCNCVDGADCFDHSGGCPAGCASGYTGEDCWTALPLCSQEGFFGNDCQYECHCDNDVACDGSTGACPGDRCHYGWFGPACQYESLPFTEVGATTNWLTDNNGSTCYNDSSLRLTFSLDTPQSISLLRLVVGDSDYTEDVQVTYYGREVLNLCPVEQRTRVDATTLDISCLTSVFVSEMILSGSGVSHLCTLHIGRAIAERETSEDSDLTPWIVAGGIAVLLVVSVAINLLIWRRLRLTSGQSNERVNDINSTIDPSNCQESVPSNSSYNQLIVYQRPSESSGQYDQTGVYVEPVEEHKVDLQVDEHYSNLEDGSTAFETEVQIPRSPKIDSNKKGSENDIAST